MSVPRQPELLVPDWPAPRSVRAVFTTRRGGHSHGPWQGFNLATHVGDDAQDVARNRALLAGLLPGADTVAWLEQVHGTTVVHLAAAPPRPLTADAAITSRPGLACAVLVADCVPILLTSRDGNAVAAVHAGWRGLADGIVAQAVAAFRVPPSTLMAWIGPCIGPTAYTIGAELAARFTALGAGRHCLPHADGWHLDLHGLARHALARAGVDAVHGAARCVHGDAQAFYSYRRDGRTGRMAALIWRDARIAPAA